MATTDDARTMLVQAAVDNAGTDHNSVEHAIGLFQRRGATRDEKRSAIVVLAGILEANRPLLKDKLKKDEGALFNVANNFDLRHNNDKQQGDYGEVFLDWVFWWYLATVELTQRLLDRQGASS